MGKKAVLVGINYPGTTSELYGCVNDVRQMYRCLVDHYGFSNDDITILIDTDDKFQMPTGKNIRAAIQRLVSSAKPDDTLFIHYSGHGTRHRARIGDDDDTGYDECIVPSDFNLIYDDEIRDLMNKVPEGCALTFLSDSCHSGGLIENLKEQIGSSTQQRGSVRRELETCEEIEINGIRMKSRYLPLPVLIEMLKEKTGKNDISIENLWQTLHDEFGEDASPIVKDCVKGKSIQQKPSADGAMRAILLSGCQSYQYSMDVRPTGDRKDSYGAFSYAIQKILQNSTWKVSHQVLVTRARDMLRSVGYPQSPGLYCDDRYVHASFLRKGRRHILSRI